jgi:N-methylhydantoinase B
MKVDPITLEVIGNALDSIVEEAGEVLVRASYSTNIKERRDSSTALFDRQGRTLCQAAHIPIHLGSLFGVVAEIVARHPVEKMREGDVFIGNDAYTGGGTHLPDIVLAEPIFVDGEIVAWATNLAHHSDFVDRGHAHIFQEGLRIPPVRLHRAGVLQQDVLDLILLNCQVPDERLADLRAQGAANRLAITRYQSLCRKYGTALLLAAGDALLDSAERRMRAGIAAIPDGTYDFEDTFDSEELPEILQFSISVRIAGDEIFLDFQGPPQVRASLNLVWTALAATTYYAVKSVIDPDAPANAGLFRPIHITAPLGSIVNCTSPAAVAGRTNTAQRVVDLVHGALAQAIPERLTAAHNGAVSATNFSGIDPVSGKFYVYVETIGGGFGARATKDGLDGVHAHVTNTSNLPVEALEIEYPLMVEDYELIDDSGGAGKFRGGMGIRRSIRIEGHDCRVDVRGTRRFAGPWGLLGGLPGATFRAEFDPPLPDGFRKHGLMHDGQLVTVMTPGAGGYGDPLARDRALVDRDLAEGRISAQSAHNLYGHLRNEP